MKVSIENVRLTEREIEVILLIVEGNSSRVIANKLYVSKRTVDFHLARIYEKLQVSNRVQLFRCAVAMGLVLPLESLAAVVVA